jgi:amidohydrolase
MSNTSECGCSAGHIYDPAKLDAARAEMAKAAGGVSNGPISSTNDSEFVPAISVHPDVEPHIATMTALREHFHKHPELSFKEFETAKFVAQELRMMSDGALTVVEGIGKVGVVAFVYGTGPASDKFDQFCVLLRADMDALPLQEAATDRNERYCSVNADVMHACGHDGHMAMLLTAARVITSPAYRAGLPSNLCVKFCFQPAEESGGGGRFMVDDGVLEASAVTGPYVDEVYGIHLWSYAPLGQVWTRKGSLMAASDKFEITVRGSGGHGAVPNGTKDAVMIGAHLVSQLHTVVARNVSPLDAAVLTVGAFNAGYTYNIIADKAVLQGTVRTLQRETQVLMEKRVRQICAGVAAAYDCEIDCRYMYGYPATVNGPDSAVDRVAAAARATVGDAARAVQLDVLPTMGAEDFAFFLNARPGCFFFVGCSPDASDLMGYPHHKSSFDFDVAALPVGASCFLRIVESYL